jgi:hypothetical protein
MKRSLLREDEEEREGGQIERDRTAIGGDELVARPRGWLEADYEGAGEKEEQPCGVRAEASLGFYGKGIGDLLLGWSFAVSRLLAHEVQSRLVLYIRPKERLRTFL